MGANRGSAALALDDLAQALTFGTRAAGRLVLGRRADRERAQLAPCCAHGHNDARVDPAAQGFRP